MLEEEELPTNLKEDEVFEKEKERHANELKMLKRKRKEMERRQQLVDMQNQLVQERKDIHDMVWNQHMQVKEIEVQLKEAEVEKVRRERALEERLERVEMESRKSEGGPVERQEVASKKAESWLEQHNLGNQGIGVDWDARSMLGATYAHEQQLAQLREKAAKGNKLTKSQQKIQELEQEVRRYKQEAMMRGDNREAAMGTGILQLKQMGLMLKHLPDDQMIPAKWGGLPKETERRKLKEDIQQSTWLLTEEGKLETNTCVGCIEKMKIKSGKFVKSNIGIKRQEQWPHVNVMRKYTKRTTFDQMEFDAFVAGETRVIINMMEKEEAMGCLKVPCRVAHWLCKCKEWGIVRSLYEAIIDSVEMGEEEWTSDFAHYETMIPICGRVESRKEECKERKEVDIYWCKPYQRGQCGEGSPHISNIKPDEPPVSVLHICAQCWMRDRKRLEHPEVECSSKK